MNLVAVILAWLGLVPIMIINGVARASLYGPRMAELRAHQLSTLTGVLLLLAYAWWVSPWLDLDAPLQAFGAGGIWLALTIAFEFGFGHFVAGHSWRQLLADYNLRAGRLWSLLLLFVAAAPWLIMTVRA